MIEVTCPRCGLIRSLAESTVKAHKDFELKNCRACTSRQNIAKVKHPGVYPHKPLEQRFWDKVEKTESCWLWLGFVAPNGYGQIQINKRPVLVHRLAYEIAHGFSLSTGHEFEIDHLCRNKRCVNPLHLELVTHRENTLRGIGITAKFAQVTHCPQGHLYDLLNTYFRPDGGRDCKICQRIRATNSRLSKVV